MSENELPTVCFADSPLWEGSGIACAVPKGASGKSIRIK